MVLKILLITSKTMCSYAKDIAKQVSVDSTVDVLCIDIPNILFLTEEKLMDILKDVAHKYDAVVLPPLIPIDFDKLSEKLNTMVVRGPKNLADLPILLRVTSWRELSPDKPLDEIVLKNPDLRIKLLKEYAYIYRDIARHSKYIEVDDIKVPIRPPPIAIVVEITDTDRRDQDQVMEFVHRYREIGVDVVCLGFTVGFNDYNLIHRYIKKIVDVIGYRVCVDSPNIDILKKSIRDGVSMVMSLSTDIPLERIPEEFKDKIIVLIDRRYDVDKLIDYAEKLVSRGFRYIVLDPLLTPPVVPGIAQAITRYMRVTTLNCPVMAGLGNVYELMDVDSHGVISVLMTILSEIGVSTYLITEHSVKARNASCEAVLASRIVSLSLAMKRLPKDLPISLLLAKRKYVDYEEQYEEYKPCFYAKLWNKIYSELK